MTARIAALGPFLLVAFINAMVDLGHKIIIQNTLFKIYDDAAQVALTAVVNALILLPFILLFTPAGFLSDRFAKPKIMRWAALSAVFITLLITLSYYQGWFQLAFALTFILAMQSALYSPAKYGYIREVASREQIAPANGFLQATTIVAILTGIFLFTVLFELLLAGKDYPDEATLIQHIAPLGWLLVGFSVVEYLFARRLPDLPPARPAFSFDWQSYRKGLTLQQNIATLRTNQLIWWCILGLSIFWGISQTMLAVFPAFAKIVLNETNTIVIQGLLACSGIGIIIGSLLAGRLCQHRIRYSLLVIGGGGLFLMLLLVSVLNSVLMFALTIIAFGVFGGLFIVPLNAMLQWQAPIERLGTILAGNNWIQNLTMVSFLMLTWLAASWQTGSARLLEILPWLTLLLLIPVLWQLKRKIAG